MNLAGLAILITFLILAVLLLNAIFPGYKALAFKNKSPFKSFLEGLSELLRLFRP